MQPLDLAHANANANAKTRELVHQKSTRTSLFALAIILILASIADLLHAPLPVLHWFLIGGRILLAFWSLHLALATLLSSGRVPLWALPLVFGFSVVFHGVTIAIAASAATVAASLTGLALLLLTGFFLPVSVVIASALTISLIVAHFLPIALDGSLSTQELITLAAAVIVATAALVGRALGLLNSTIAFGVETAEHSQDRQPLALDSQSSGEGLDPAASRRATMQRLTLEEWIASLPTPLLVLADDGVALARNQPAELLLAGLPTEPLLSWLAGLKEEQAELRLDLADSRPRLFQVHSRRMVFSAEAIRLVALSDQTRRSELEVATAEALRNHDVATERTRNSLAELAHELRTPLNGIRGFAQILQDAVQEPVQRAHLDRLNQAVDGMVDAIDRHLLIVPKTKLLTSDKGNQRQLSVLLVEDDDASRLLARALLEKDGHTVVEAANGPDAVDRAAEGVFDVVLMDIRLPGFGGTTAVRRIRALPDPEKAAVPVIAMSANVLPDQVARYRKAGMRDMIAKPIERERLRTVLAEIAADQAHAMALSTSPVPWDLAPRNIGEAPKPPPTMAAPAAESLVLDRRVLDGHLAILGKARVSHVIASFLASAPTVLATASDALTDRDLVQLARAAHKLGSGALTVGLTDLANAARKVEADATGGRDDDAIAGTEKLRAMLPDGMAALEHYRAQIDDDR